MFKDSFRPNKFDPDQLAHRLQDTVNTNIQAMEFMVRVGYSEGESLMLLTDMETIDKVIGLPREILGMLIELRELEAERLQGLLDGGDDLDRRLLAIDIELLWFMTVCKMNGHIDKENKRREQAADDGDWKIC